MQKTNNLKLAKANKNDEFYTLLEDIEKEILHHEDYVKQFNGKIIYCNCDNPEWSNFFFFFKSHFHEFGLKKLISTYLDDGDISYKTEFDGINIVRTKLSGNGDFRSDECIKILKNADIVCTNPPFSLFRQFVSLLTKYNKKFIIIGAKSAIAYRDFFQLLKEEKCFIGYNYGNGTMRFSLKIDNNKPVETETKPVASYWFTNFSINKTHKSLNLTKNYKDNERDYPKYDNYDAIECGKLKNIPRDYFPCWFSCRNKENCNFAKTNGKISNKDCHMSCNGVIGVPITYLSKHCPEQFIILGKDEQIEYAENECTFFKKPSTEKQNEYKKLLKEYRIQNAYILDENGIPKPFYHRIFIRRKN